MMISVMAYAALVATLLAMAAVVAERIVAAARWPRRWIWLLALAASIVLPAYSVLNVPAASEPDFVTTQNQATVPVGEPVEEPRRSIVSASAIPRLDWPEWPDLDRFNGLLISVWIASSIVVVLFYVLTWFSLRLSKRRWERARIAGYDVELTERLGPAVFGFVRPKIVVPRWLLGADPETRHLVLLHERSHIEARDQLLVLLALVLVAAAPWNLPLWWQMRRLRLAIEVDCDARVMQHGADATAYSETLLSVRQQRAMTPITSIALTEPVSHLERRIRLVTGTITAARRPIVAGCAFAAIGFLAAACVMDAPSLDRSPQPSVAVEPGETQRQPVTGLRLGGERVVILVDVSSSMLGRTVEEIDRQRRMPAEQQRESKKWNQLVNTVEWLTAQVQPWSQFQVIAFNDGAYSLIPGTDGQWLDGANRGQLAQAVRNLRNEVEPGGPTSLHAAFRAVRDLEPRADNIFLLVDGLPTVGEDSLSATGSVSGEQRMALFEAATIDRSVWTSVNVLLLPLEGDPLAAPAYWTLALESGGSMLALAEDWP